MDIRSGRYQKADHTFNSAFYDLLNNLERRLDYAKEHTSLPEMPDLARRDFTMNAIALGLDGSLQGPFDGVDDIKAGRIHCVGEPAQRFQEDGLRVMRALGFGAAFGYEVEEKTARSTHENRHILEYVSAERIHVVLRKLLA